MLCREIIESMAPVKRTSHAVYDTKYHVVWISYYRKEIFSEAYTNRLKEIFCETSEHYECETDTIEVVLMMSISFSLLPQGIPQQGWSIV